MQPAAYDDVRRLPEALRLRVPRGLPAAVQTAARKHHQTGAEWVRQTLLKSLRDEGLALHDGGELEQVGSEARA
jgi:hypothetical protein